MYMYTYACCIFTNTKDDKSSQILHISPLKSDITSVYFSATRVPAASWLLPFPARSRRSSRWLLWGGAASVDRPTGFFSSTHCVVSGVPEATSVPGDGPRICKYAHIISDNQTTLEVGSKTRHPLITCTSITFIGHRPMTRSKHLFSSLNENVYVMNMTFNPCTYNNVLMSP